jgi:putative ABC transport system permease protein
MRHLTTRLLHLGRRIVFRWRRAELDCELAEELEFHRALKEDENRVAGFSAQEAAELTRRQMGNMTVAREESRELWSFVALERLGHDLRHALRMFLRNPGFTALATISLALGIGGSAAVFSLVNALLIQPLPYFEPNRLLRITGVYPKAAFVVFQQESRTMEVAAASPGSEWNLTGQGEAVRLFGSAVSVNLFTLLGAPVELGRSFEPGDERPGNDAVLILSHALWKNKFGGDAGIIGRMIQLNGAGRSVVGVMPAGFSYPSARAQLWVPMRIDPSIVMEDYWGGEFTPLIGRLRPGAKIEQASGEIASLVPQIRKSFPFPMPRDWNAEATAIPLQRDIVGGVREKLFVLFSSVAIILLIACANVASLLLARATVRRREIALRAALGAGRGRIIRQLLTESVLLSLLGGTLGILLGTTALAVIRSVLPRDTPGIADVTIGLDVLAFAAGLALCTGIAFGMAPALNAAQIDLTESIKTGSRRQSSRGWGRFRNSLIAAELALTVILLVAAGLLIKTVHVLSEVDPGFRAEQILTIRITPNQSLCDDRPRCIALYDELLSRARAIPGVSGAAIASTIPMDGRFTLSAIPVDVEGHPKTADFPAPMFWAGAITPDYLSILRIPLLAGRAFSAADGAQSPGVILVAASTARRFWPGEDPIGKHIKSAADRQWRTVVGVVADVRQVDLTGNSPSFVKGAIYMPYAQAAQDGGQLPAAIHLLVKASTEASRIRQEMAALAANLSPNVPVSEVQEMDAVVSGSIADRRATMSLFASFAAAALILAVAGVYGLVSYSVSQRTYEIGLRMAIGATKGSILALILRQSLRVAATGIAAGIVAAIVLTRFLSNQLYGVAATDLLTFSAVGALLLGVTVLASCVPAWRAAQIHPTKSLRVD